MVISSQGNLDLLLKNHYKNILISYENSKLIPKVLDKKINLIIDSGAYSVWTKNKKVDLNEYIRFAKWAQNHNRLNSLVVVNLDVIPGIFGVVPSKEDIEESSIEGWHNYEKMKNAGINVMHIFHQHEDIKWLKKLMKEGIDYIGISPANDLKTKPRLKWLKYVFSIVRDKKKAHGFGVTAIDILKEIPFFSADSSNWTSLVRFGVVSHYKDLSSKNLKYKKLRNSLAMNIDYQALFEKRKLENELNKVIQNAKLMERDITKLWMKRGIKFD